MSESQMQGLVALEYDFIRAATVLDEVAKAVYRNRAAIPGAEDVHKQIRGMRKWLLEILGEVDQPISNQVQVYEATTR